MRNFLLILAFLPPLAGFAQYPMLATTPPAVLDSCYQVPYDSPTTITQLTPLPNSKVMAAGSFNYNGTGNYHTVRFLPESGLDTAYRESRSIDFSPTATAFFPDGRVLQAAPMIGPNVAPKIVGLNMEGSVDTGFTTSFTSDNGDKIKCMAVQGGM